MGGAYCLHFLKQSRGAWPTLLLPGLQHNFGMANSVLFDRICTFIQQLLYD